MVYTVTGIEESPEQLEELGDKYFQMKTEILDGSKC